MKNEIKNIEKKKSGIYCIESFANNKKYIGSAVNVSNRYRLHLHYLSKNKHDNIHLQRHFNKYGKSDLHFYILELCEKEILIEREQFYIDNLTNLFNIRFLANSNIGIKIPEDKKTYGRFVSEETKSKISIANTGNKYNLGKHHSEETKKKLSEISRNRIISHEWKSNISKSLKGRIFSLEHKKNLSKAMKGNKNCEGVIYSKERNEKISKKLSIPILQFRDNFLIKEWASAKIASKELKINASNIRSCVRNERKIAGGFQWKKK